MTPKQLEKHLDTIGWSVRGLADRLGVPESRPRRWIAGMYPVPDEVAHWLEKLAAAHERLPVPQI